MLEVKNLNVKRGKLQILWDISLNVKDGEAIALIGANGAGKTTLLSTVAGLLKPISGTVRLDGKEITGLPPYKIVNLGLSFIPEDRKLFSNCTVLENLILGAYTARARKNIKEMLKIVYQIFPRLKEREKQLAATLSGGEQRMLAIARGLLSNPHLLILDEPSQGLSPKLTSEIYRALEKLREEYKFSILFAEQNVHYALTFADRAYVIEVGKITLEGKSSDLLADKHVKEAFLGI